MPPMDESLEESKLARVLAYGAAKTRKTTWALKAAEAGFNVIMCDTDHSYHVAAQLPIEAQKRIFHLDMRMPEESTANCASLALMTAAKPTAMYWHEKDRCYVPVSKCKEDEDYVLLDFTKLTPKDVLLLDTWTAYVDQCALSERPVLDVTKVPKLEWDDYAKLRLGGDLFIQNLSRLNCHVIVIGHGETYAKRKADADPKGKPHEVTDSVRMQPSSFSRAHGEKLAKNFTDVLFFEVPNPSVGTMISTKGSIDFDAGSRCHPPVKLAFDKLPFTSLCSAEDLALAATNTAYSSEGVKIVKGSDIAASRGKSAAIPVGDKPAKLTFGKR